MAARLEPPNIRLSVASSTSATSSPASPVHKPFSYILDEAAEPSPVRTRLERADSIASARTVGSVDVRALPRGERAGEWDNESVYGGTDDGMSVDSHHLHPSSPPLAPRRSPHDSLSSLNFSRPTPPRQSFSPSPYSPSPNPSHSPSPYRPTSDLPPPQPSFAHAPRPDTPGSLYSEYYSPSELDGLHSRDASGATVRVHSHAHAHEASNESYASAVPYPQYPEQHSPSVPTSFPHAVPVAPSQPAPQPAPQPSRSRPIDTLLTLPLTALSPDELATLGIHYHSHASLPQTSLTTPLLKRRRRPATTSPDEALALAAECFRMSAERKDLVGMVMWGLTLRHGWGVEGGGGGREKEREREKEGWMWLRRAADRAVRLLDGEGARGMEEEIKSVLILSIYEVGQSFFRGLGTKKDKALAAQYFEVAAKLGDCDAMQELAFCYANGKGVKKDLRKAAGWYREAVRKGASSVGLQWVWKEKYM